MRSCGLVLTLLLTTAAHAAPSALEIVVAYPPANYSVPYDHVIFEGHVTPGANLSLNGQALNVGADGLFMEWLPLKMGKNALKLLSSLGSQRRTVTFNVNFNPPRALPAKPTAIKAGTLTPDRALSLYTRVPAEGRTFTVGFQGSPGGRASVSIPGLGRFALTEQPASTRPPLAAGWYSAALTLPENLPLGRADVKVSLTGRDGNTVVATAPGTLNSTPTGAARVAEVTAADVGEGVNPSTSALTTGPGTTDLLFPKQGQRLAVLGDLGDAYLVRGPGGLATALKSVLKLLPAGTPPPTAGAGVPQLLSLPGEWQVRLPISQRTVFSLDESQVGDSAGLSWTLADAVVPAGHTPSDPHTPALSWQPDGSSLRLTVQLPQTQNWGYHVTAEPGAWVLHIRQAPILDPLQPLKNRLILLDPGHGGSELGGAGSLGEPEKNITLPIARRVAELLRAQGADARLTRDRDVRVPLYDRPLMAEQLRADLLISIHANALPDGADPRQRRGLEVYTFHPMTWGLARALIKSIAAATNLPTQSAPPLTLPGLRVSNLALTRPTSQRSLLIETAYLTQPGDLRLLMDPVGREAIAQGIAQGIADDYAAQARLAAPLVPPAPPLPELTPLPRPPQPDAPLVPTPAPAGPTVPTGPPLGPPTDPGGQP
ncbi:N-acetylmuramoyl-L-alanine amidase [Deinococcus rubellus]|uniref:N-acetylmuramoyl-L-alanine amidase n=1 Tax=Deinococcus rubellus TaxID=1889240 RepID=A0ABY5YP66_9DEIO|nr:N-acetylmuramoyl-L-alanine amidase [Deinococcus rubellus]UWX65513.1 N-acetylmuramoyl-L-alanine amidase [Deinococcus rubellus]